MGTFISANELKARSTSPLIKSMDPESIERRFVKPAERRLENDLRLEIETSQVPCDSDARDVPSYLRGLFDSYPAEETKFLDDVKDALVLLADRMAVNPDGYSSQGIRGASATFGSPIPSEVYSIMRKWVRASGYGYGTVCRG